MNMAKTGIFYGPENGSVNRVAERIAEMLGPEKAELVAVANATAADFDRYDQILFGISTIGKETWDGKQAAGDWARFMPEIGKGRLEGKTTAIFGLGDHITYASHFVDAMGQLAGELRKAGARLCGQVSAEGYEFEDSAALADGMFVGLPLDEDYEPELTPGRLSAWLGQLSSSFSF